MLPRNGDLDTDIKTPLYHFRDVIALGLKLSEDAKAWDKSYRIAEISLAITIVTILFLPNFVLIYKAFLALTFARKVLQRKMKMAIHVDNRPIITSIRHVRIINLT